MIFKQLSIENKEEIVVLLNEINDDFGFSFNAEYDVEVYVEKILKLAYNIACYENGHLIGVLSCYCNDIETKKAFITLVGVRRECRGKGVASALFSQLFEYTKKSQFSIVGIETRNVQAFKLYQYLGFTLIRHQNTKLSGTVYYLEKVLD